MSLYWKALAKLYPNAKVLLTVRDPVRWYKSVDSTISRNVKFLQSSWLALPMRCLMKMIGASDTAGFFTCFAPTYLGPNYPQGLIGAVNAGQETAVKFFNDWVELVKKEIPADRFLVFEVKDGWEPLCQFLQVPVPDEPFPNANDTAEQQAKLRAMKKFCLFSYTILVAGLRIAFYFLKDSFPMPKLTLQ